MANAPLCYRPIVFPSQAKLEAVVVEFKFRAQTLVLYCRAASGATIPIHNIFKNDQHTVFMHGWADIFCQGARLQMSDPTDFYGDHMTLGVRELRLYKLGYPEMITKVQNFTSPVGTTEVAGGREKMIYNTNLGMDYNAMLSMGEWRTSAVVMAGDDPSMRQARKLARLTLDFGLNTKRFWGMVIEFGTTFPANLDVFVSLDNIIWSKDPIVLLRSKNDVAAETLFSRRPFRARYLRLDFLETGTTQSVGSNTTGSTYVSFTYYSLKWIRLFGSDNLGLDYGIVASSNEQFRHTSEYAVNGNLTESWLSYPGSSKASIMVDLLDTWKITSEVITPRPITPTFGVYKRDAPTQCRSVASGCAVETSLGGVSWGRLVGGRARTSILFGCSV